MKTVFELNPQLPEYFETSDGVKFFKEPDAKTHARSLKDKSIKKEERPKGTSKKNKSASKELTPIQKAALRAESISKLETVAAVEKALEGETAKTVIKAGEERIIELNKSTDK